MPQSVVVVEKVTTGTEAERILRELAELAGSGGVGTDRRRADALELHWDVDPPAAIEATEGLLARISETWSIHVRILRPS